MWVLVLMLELELGVWDCGCWCTHTHTRKTRTHRKHHDTRKNITPLNKQTNTHAHKHPHTDNCQHSPHESTQKTRKLSLIHKQASNHKHKCKTHTRTQNRNNTLLRSRSVKKLPTCCTRWSTLHDESGKTMQSETCVSLSQHSSGHVCLKSLTGQNRKRCNLLHFLIISRRPRCNLLHLLIISRRPRCKCNR